MNKGLRRIKQTENKNPGRVFEVKQLENAYIEILKSYGSLIESRVPRFGDVLKEKLPGIELQIGKKLTLYFESTADTLINESTNDSNSFYETLLKTALPLRRMMAKTSNNLDDIL